MGLAGKDLLDGNASGASGKDRDRVGGLSFGAQERFDRDAHDRAKHVKPAVGTGKIADRRMDPQPFFV